MEHTSIAVIGTGNLGKALINGLLEEQLVQPANLYATRRNLDALFGLTAKGVQVTSDNKKAAAQARILIVAVKPYNVQRVLEELTDVLTDQHIVVSVATGVTLDELKRYSGGKPKVARAMPNISAEVQASLTCLTLDELNEEDRVAVDRIFSVLGENVHIPEQLMEAATILGACGIAFVLRFMRAMVQGGVQIGFDSQTANQIVNHTVYGAAKLIMDNKYHPEAAIDLVTTPKGCTIEGLNEMEHAGFSSSLIKGIVASYKNIERN
jgi:pyrroline-5-carboxylate reductase